jgi:hypothetical protein
VAKKKAAKKAAKKTAKKKKKEAGPAPRPVSSIVSRPLARQDARLADVGGDELRNNEKEPRRRRFVLAALILRGWQCCFA